MLQTTSICPCVCSQLRQQPFFLWLYAPILLLPLPRQVAFLQEQLAASADFTASMPSVIPSATGDQRQPLASGRVWLLIPKDDAQTCLCGTPANEVLSSFVPGGQKQQPLPRPEDVVAHDQMERNAILGAAKELADMQASGFQQPSAGSGQASGIWVPNLSACSADHHLLPAVR